MTTAEISIVTIAAVLCFVLWLASDRLGSTTEDGLEARTARRVLVTLHDGTAFAGDLWETGPASIVLRNAEQIDSDGSGRVTVDGELLILRSEVSYLQIPNGAAR